MSSRHNSLADAMSALLAYRNRPDEVHTPLQTNWSIAPADDKEPEVLAEMHAERRIQIFPTIQEIMRQVDSGDIERNKDGKTVRIGRLRFSDGSQTEVGYKRGPDGVALTRHRMPAGAMLGCRETESRLLGGDIDAQDVSASNRYFTEVFGVKPRARKPAAKIVKRKNRTHNDDKATLAAAYANTHKLPTVKRYPPGLPLAGARIADSFLGMRKLATGNGGSVGWEDVSTSIIERETWANAVAALSDRDRATLDAVAHERARNMHSISPGGTERGARKRGKRLLLAANDNLQESIKKFA